MAVSEINAPGLRIQVRGKWIPSPGVHGFSHELQEPALVTYRAALKGYLSALSPFELDEAATNIMRARLEVSVVESKPAMLAGKPALRFSWTDGVREIDSWFFGYADKLWEFSIGRAYAEDGTLPVSDEEFLATVADSTVLEPDGDRNLAR